MTIPPEFPVYLVSVSFRTLHEPLKTYIMQLIMKEGNMTITMDLIPDGENNITAEDVLIAAYDAISRIFSQEAVIRAYHRTDPDTMALRDDVVK